MIPQICNLLKNAFMHNVRSFIDNKLGLNIFLVHQSFKIDLATKNILIVTSFLAVHDNDKKC